MMKRILIGVAIVVVFIILIRYFYGRTEMLVGDDAIEITFEDLKGQKRSLGEFEDQYVLLTFWGSWCVPCRESNKKLTSFYKEQDSTRLKIISIGIEKDKAEWNKAVSADSLYWTEQFTSLNMFSNIIVENYGVHETPTYFLINPDKIVIAKSGNIDQIIRKYNQTY